MTPSERQEQGELVIERIFHASREVIWDAWTKPEHVMRWYGPDGMALPVCKMDFRVGGRFLFGMRSPAGNEHWTTGVYREIVPLQRIVTIESPSDADGNVASPTQHGMPDGAPVEMTIVVTFEDVEGGKTRLTLRHLGWTDGDVASHAGVAWNQAFDKLEAAFTQVR